MGYNKFSGLYEPDREKDLVKGEPNVEAFREAIAEIDKIRSAENEEELIMNMVLVARRYNNQKLEISDNVDYDEAIGQLEDVYSEINADMLVMALQEFPKLYAYGEPLKVDESVLDIEAKYTTDENAESLMGKLVNDYDIRNNQETRDAVAACVENLELDKISKQQLQEKSENPKGFHPVSVRRGEIYWCNYTKGVGCEFSSNRTILILSNDSNNRFSQKVNGVAMEGGRKSNNYQIEVCDADLESGHISHFTGYAKVAISDIVSIDKARLSNKIGKIGAVKMKDIEKAVKAQLDLR